jgi:hypothetical protein
VFLQELLAPGDCLGRAEPDPVRTCYDAARREPQVRRLLGPGFSIACDAHRQRSCTGVATSLGPIAGAAPGALVDADTAALPMEACEWSEGTCSDEHCDAGSSVSRVRVETRRGPLWLANVHLTAPGRSGGRVFWGAACRERQLRQLFEGGEADIAAGDFNLDPVRLISQGEATLWDRHVGVGRRFRDLTPHAPDGVQYGTRRGNFGMAVDHVLAAGLAGRCSVHGHGIGIDPGTEALDAGCAGAESAGRIDHFAIVCEFEFD